VKKSTAHLHDLLHFDSNSDWKKKVGSNTPRTCNKQRDLTETYHGSHVARLAPFLLLLEARAQGRRLSSLLA
jgi:hypothetical protein